MNTASRLVVFTMFAVAASAQDSVNCQFSLPLKEIAPAMGPKVAIQPVFSRASMKGFRVYGTSESDLLRAHAISSGSMMTHICGVPVHDIPRDSADVCCGSDVSREFEVIFLINDEERRVLVRRQP